MKTISLRALVRAPIQVKRWTRGGSKVQVTDHGKPLWVIEAVPEVAEDLGRAGAIDEILDEVLREPRNRTSAARLLEASRR